MKFGTSIGAVAAIAALGAAAPASGHVDPPGCSAGGSLLEYNLSDPDGIHIIHRDGDHVEVAARVKNNANPQVCSVTDATVTARVPAPDGTPGPTTTLATDIDLLAGTPPTNLPTTAPYDYNFNPGVFSGPVSIALSGDQHDSAMHTPGFLTSAGRTLVVTRPTASISVAPVISSGPVPFGATYSYTLTNTSPDNTFPGEPEPEIVDGSEETSVIADDTCSPLTFTGGNTMVEFPPSVDPGETWTFTCSRTFSTPGSFTNHVRVDAQSHRDGRPWPESPAQSTVTALGPDMTATKSHNGDFVAGETGRVYTLTARNSGNAATSGLVTLQDSLPAGLTATAISGDGWSCSLGTLSCTRSDALAGGASYPPVSVTVDVAADAPDQVTNVASVSGGGETPTGNNSANDPTAIARPAGDGDGGGGGGGNADTDPPETSLKKPKLKGSKVTFKFGSDETGSTFECRLDKKPFKACTSPKTYKKLKDGKHKFFVLATDPAGNEDDKAAKAKFEVG